MSECVTRSSEVFSKVLASEVYLYTYKKPAASATGFFTRYLELY